jgi:hypothetical protein
MIDRMTRSIAAQQLPAPRRGRGRARPHAPAHLPPAPAPRPTAQRAAMAIPEPAGDAAGVPAAEVVAAIDQGTQSTRVFLFNARGEPVASHQVPLRQIYPKAG